jgi:hypothetical protein
MIDVLNDLQSHFLAMSLKQVIAHPRNQVIFEYAFNQLVQKVRCKEFMDVGARESVCKRLIRIK